MRLLVVGKLNGQLSTAVKMAMSAGAKVSHVETIAAATHALRAGQGADLLLVDGDPLSNIAILQDQKKFLAIMKDGQFHKAPEIHSARTRWSQTAA